MQQSSQASEGGCQLQGVSPGVGSQLRVAINLEPRHSLATALTRDPTSSRTGETPILPQKEWPRSMPQEGLETAGFGDSKQGLLPEIETLSHRPGEHRVQPETREIE